MYCNKDIFLVQIKWELDSIGVLNETRYLTLSLLLYEYSGSSKVKTKKLQDSIVHFNKLMIRPFPLISLLKLPNPDISFSFSFSFFFFSFFLSLPLTGRSRICKTSVVSLVICPSTSVERFEMGSV